MTARTTPTYTLESLRESLIRGEHAGLLRMKHGTTFDQLDEDARLVGFVFDRHGKPHAIADDTPEGAEGSQLDDRPSPAAGDAPYDQVAALTIHDESVHPTGEPQPDPPTGYGLWQAGALRRLPVDLGDDLAPAHLVPAIREQIRAELAAAPPNQPGDWQVVAPDDRLVRQPTWLQVLGLTPAGLVELIEAARTDPRRAMGVLAGAVIEDLTDLASLVRA